LMRSAGYLVTEWDESFGTDPGELKNASSDAGVRFCGAYRWFDFQDDHAFKVGISELDSIGKTLRAIGVTNLIVADRLRPERVAIAGRASHDPSFSLASSSYRAIADRVDRLVENASRLDLAVHYHNHVGTYVETPPELETMLELLENTGAGLCFDTGHYAYGGGDPVAFLHEHAGRCTYIHLKDVDSVVVAKARELQWTFLDALRHIVFPPIGNGGVDPARVMSALVRSGYAGLVVIEQDTCLGDPTGVARMNLERSSSALRSALLT